MNESIFFIHIAIVILFLLVAARIGKEALVTWSCLQIIIANLFVLKQMTFLGLDITCSDVYIVGNLLGLNLIQEFYGKNVAQKTMWITFFCMIFFTLMAKIHLLYKPNIHDISQEAFFSILSSAPRLFVASIITFFVVQKVDILFFGFLKKVYNHSHLLPRTIVCLLVSQSLDTALFTILALYGSVGSVTHVMLTALCVKLIVIACLSPVTSFTKKFLPQQAAT